MKQAGQKLMTLEKVQKNQFCNITLTPHTV